MSRRSSRPGWIRVVLTLIGVMVAYFAVPLTWTGVHVLPAALVTLLAVALLGAAIGTQVVRHVKDGEAVGLPMLAILLELVLAVFALGYFLLERNDAGQFVDLTTRIDSLYFTLQVLSTVGLGDVHPEGQAARTMVSLQMAFDLVFVAAAGSLLVSSAKDRIGKRPSAPEEDR